MGWGELCGTASQKEPVWATAHVWSQEHTGDLDPRTLPYTQRVPSLPARAGWALEASLTPPGRSIRTRTVFVLRLPLGLR